MPEDAVMAEPEEPDHGAADASWAAVPAGSLAGCPPVREAALSSSVTHCDSSAMAGWLASETTRPVRAR